MTTWLLLGPVETMDGQSSREILDETTSRGIAQSHRLRLTKPKRFGLSADMKKNWIVIKFNPKTMRRVSMPSGWKGIGMLQSSQDVREKLDRQTLKRLEKM